MERSRIFIARANDHFFSPASPLSARGFIFRPPDRRRLLFRRSTYGVRRFSFFTIVRPPLAAARPNIRVCTCPRVLRSVVPLAITSAALPALLRPIVLARGREITRRNRFRLRRGFCERPVGDARRSYLAGDDTKIITITDGLSPTAAVERRVNDRFGHRRHTERRTFGRTSCA